MMYRPLELCLETGKVDSVRISVWIDESLIPENAPYGGYVKLDYHPGTCFVSRLVQRPHYMDTIIVMNATLSADHRVQESEWQVGGEGEPPRGTYWYSATGELDSSLSSSLQGEGDGVWVMGHTLERHVRTPLYRTIKSYYRRGETPWILEASDSIVTDGASTKVYTVEEGFRSMFLCQYSGANYECDPKQTDGNTADLHKEVWHLTGGRVDSLRTLNEQGMLVSTERYFWSSRIPGGTRRIIAAGGPRRGRLPGRDFSILGRRELHGPGGSRMIFRN